MTNLLTLSNTGVGSRDTFVSRKKVRFVGHFSRPAETDPDVSLNQDQDLKRYYLKGHVIDRDNQKPLNETVLWPTAEL